MKITDQKDFILDKDFFEEYKDRFHTLCEQLKLKNTNSVNIVFAQFELEVVKDCNSKEMSRDRTVYLINKINFLSTIYGNEILNIKDLQLKIEIDNNSKHFDVTYQVGKCIRGILDSLQMDNVLYDCHHINVSLTGLSLTFNAFLIEFNKSLLGLGVDADTRFLQNAFSSLFYSIHGNKNKDTQIMSFYDKMTYNIPNNNDDVLREAGIVTLNNQLYKKFKKDISSYKTINLFEVCNLLSLRKYERADNKGQIIFAPSIDKFKYKMGIKQSVKLDNYRAIRKLLEISKEDYYLLCDGDSISGIVKIEEKNHYSGNKFKVIFKGYGIWEVHTINKKIIMRVENGIPCLPKEGIDSESFRTIFESVFEDLDYNNVWKFVENAQSQMHGTMLVISDKAQDEVNRFGKQCFPVDHESGANLDIVKYITSIDGAVLLDPLGQIHAIGVILDGIVNEETFGDISRGARYNSAIRYLESLKLDDKCIIVVISEDGMIDMWSNKTILKKKNMKKAKNRV